MNKALSITREDIVKSAVSLVDKSGWESLNARSLAKEIGHSTKPLYRLFGGMEPIKEEVLKEIYKKYDKFITSRIDNKKALLTLCIAYVEFASKYKNLFVSLFLSNNLNWENIDNVLDEKWNQSTIINIVNKENLDFQQAKELFISLWLYANGLATLIATNDMTLKEEEILTKMVKAYKRFITLK